MATAIKDAFNYKGQTAIQVRFQNINNADQRKDFSFRSIRQLGAFLRSNAVPKDWSVVIEDQNLRYLDARGADLSSYTFINCCLDGACLDGAKLDYLSVEGGSARGIHLNQTYGEGMSFTNVEMPGVQANAAQWSNAVCDHCNMENAAIDNKTTFSQVGFPGSTVSQPIMNLIPEGQARTMAADIRRPQQQTGAAMA